MKIKTILASWNQEVMTTVGRAARCGFASDVTKKSEHMREIIDSFQSLKFFLTKNEVRMEVPT